MIWPHHPPRFPPLQPQGPGVVTCTKLCSATISHLPKGDDHELRSHIHLQCTSPYRHMGPTFPHPSNFAPRSILSSCPSLATPSLIEVTSPAPTTPTLMQRNSSPFKDTWRPLITSRLQLRVSVIIMTFWYIFWNGLNFFKLFKLLFSLGIDHDPPCFP